MSIIVNTNLSAMIANNCLTMSTNKLNNCMLRLSTGSRINSAKEDPAGSFYASRLNTEIRGIQVAYQNVSSAFNMVATAESDLNIINQHLERVKDLTTQFANDTLSDAEKTAIIDEVQQRLEEVDRISAESEFNDVKLLDGTRDNARFQIGGGADPTANSLTCSGVFLDASVMGLGIFTGTFTGMGDAFASSSSAASFIGVIENAITEVSHRISKAGIYEDRLTIVGDYLISKNENLSSAYSTVADADISAETASYIKYQILQQTATAMLTQANHANGTIALQLVGGL